MDLYYNLADQCRCSAQGIRLKTAVCIHYKEKPVWNLHILNGSSTVDLSSIAAFRAAVDTDKSASTEVLCRTNNASIDRSLAAQGVLSIPVNANTENFRQAVDGHDSLAAYFELWGLDSLGDPLLYLVFDIRIMGVVDPDGGSEPEDVLPDYIPGTTLTAWLHAASEFQFSADALSWHDVQGSSDIYVRFRNSVIQGEWSSPVSLLRGPEGPQGAQGDEGPAGPTGATGPQGPAGADIVGASESVSALTSGYIVVSSDAAPVMLKTNLGNLYPVEKGTMTESSGTWSIDPAAYLAYDNVQTFTGPWTVYFAGGLPEVMTIISAGTSITPLEHQVYRHTLAASDAITVDTSALTSSQCLTFELWLDMPSTPVAFTLPAGLTWIDEFTPDFSAGDTRYVIVIRWNGSGLLANLAYTEDLA